MKTKDFFTVGIGASGGGIKALTSFFEGVIPNQYASYVVATHISREHPSKLHQILANTSPLPVLRVEEKIKIEPGKVYVLPENRYIRVSGDDLELHTRDKDQLINTAVDVLFESLGISFGEKAIGVVLSGVGSDGLKGARIIEREGGFVLVQDPKTAQFNGMPNTIITFDHPDVIDHPKELGKFVSNYAENFRTER